MEQKARKRRAVKTGPEEESEHQHQAEPDVEPTENTAKGRARQAAVKKTKLKGTKQTESDPATEEPEAVSELSDANGAKKTTKSRRPSKAKEPRSEETDEAEGEGVKPSIAKTKAKTTAQRKATNSAKTQDGDGTTKETKTRRASKKESSKEPTANGKAAVASSENGTPESKKSATSSKGKLSTVLELDEATEAVTKPRKGRGKAKEIIPEAPPSEIEKPKKGRGKAKVPETPQMNENDNIAANAQPVEEKPLKGRGNAKAKASEPALKDEFVSKRNRKGKESSPSKQIGDLTEPATKPTTARGKKKVEASSEDAANGDPSVETGANGTSESIANAAAPTNGVTQRKRRNVADVDAEETPALKVSAKDKKTSVPKMNKCSTDYTGLSFALEKDALWNYKISSWNLAGLRSWETKCTEDQLPDEARHIPGYHPYWLCKPGGYAGVAIYSRKMPIFVTYGLGDDEQDQDGRLLTAEYEKFYLVCVYVPNAGNKLVTLPKRMRWDEKFHQYLQELDRKKPVILCGDMNVAHEEIDLANPKTNRKNAGFTQEERDGMTRLLSYGFVDTFRKLYPERKAAYTFWTYMGGARAKNVGWRLDYFIVSERLADKVTDNVMRTQVYGSDHCPVTLFLNL
ncbi:recombination repair protein 1 isoform X2 [Anopheles bellator]|uniref:recombination repair protein 1 isoform X2 n=1 Tax=Anopheles bellator TaxID=139047 RepID=UPI00264A4157|nr:recombination repair protein 1 isoform X2 [Anopheles bellator]